MYDLDIPRFSCDLSHEFQILNLTLINPSFLPLAIQLTLLEFYPAALSRLGPFLGSDVPEDLSRLIVNDQAVFNFLDLNFVSFLFDFPMTSRIHFILDFNFI